MMARIALVGLLFTFTTWIADGARARADQAISLGDSLLSTLACQATDVFTFDASANDSIVAHVTECSDFGGVCQVACFCFDQCLEVRDGSHILGRNCSPAGDNTQNRFRTELTNIRLSRNGLHQLAINDGQNNGRGTYTVFVQSTNRPARAELLHSSEARLGTLTTCGQVQTYTFDANMGNRVRIDMVPGAVGSIQPRLSLYAGDGAAVSIPGNGHIDEVLRRAGPFTLLAHSATDQTGTYRIDFEIEPGPPSIRIVGTGCNPCQAGQTAAFHVRLTNGDGPLDVELKTGVHAPDGSELSILGVHQTMRLQTGEVQASLFSTVIPATLPAGTYRIEVALLDPIFGLTLSRDAVTVQKQ